MAFLTELLRQGIWFIIYIAVAVGGVFAGRALRARKDRKKAEAEAAGNAE